MKDLHRPPFPVDAPFTVAERGPSLLWRGLRWVLRGYVRTLRIGLSVAVIAAVVLGLAGTVSPDVRTWLHETAARAAVEVR